MRTAMSQYQIRFSFRQRIESRTAGPIFDSQKLFTLRSNAQAVMKKVGVPRTQFGISWSRRGFTVRA
jgi:hypothetical protein